MKTIAVTGGDGQLGQELTMLSQVHPEYNWIIQNRILLDITSLEALELFFEKNSINFLINCAAYTKVDLAETELEHAQTINATSTGILASLCKKYEVQFIHISTDYVFDGAKKMPYSETDQTNPLNVYGETKLKGEVLAMENNPDTIIIRTSWVYSSFGKNFVKTIAKLCKERKSLTIVNDQLGNPTYARDLAEAILKIIRYLEGDKKSGGIYHYSNTGNISWYDFAVEINKYINQGCEIHPIPSIEYPTPAKRSLYSVLDNTKIRTTFGIEIKDWKQSLSNCFPLLS